MSVSIEEILSTARLRTYKDIAEQDSCGRSALDIYKKNVMYSKEFYALLAGLEVAVRNQFHTVLSKKYKTEDWLVKVRWLDRHQDQIEKAREVVHREKKSRATIHDLIAQLNFGFWVNLCNDPYERTLWINGLNTCFPHYGRAPDRRSVRDELDQCLKLRNQIAHLEPLIKREDLLIQDYRLITRLLYAISPDYQRYMVTFSEFENIWNMHATQKKEADHDL